MRNLKKVLSLVMALAMLCSFMVVGASAAAATTFDEFSDKDDIKNVEAVKTMVSLGVINGTDQGTYNPTGVVTRAEMAKLIAVALNGGKDPTLGTVTTTFTDVKGSSSAWAERYIAYCANLGIINGRGDSTFGPSEPVTGTAAAKMILTALGYKSDIEKLTGTEWAINTNVLANKVNLYTGIDAIDPNIGLSRDDTAQMLYNGVQANEVEYRNNYGEYSGVIYAQPNGTMLWNRFKVVKVEGVAVANQIFGIGGYSATSADKVRLINCNDYSTTDGTTKRVYDDVYPISVPNEYVGQRIVIYVKFQNALAPNAKDSAVIGSPILSEKNTLVSTGNRMAEAADVVKFVRDNSLSFGSESYGIDTSDAQFKALNGVLTANKDGSAFATGVSDASGINGTAGQKVTFIDHSGDGTVDYIIKENRTLAKITLYNTTDKELTLAGEGAISFKDVADVDKVAKDDLVLYVKYGDTFYMAEPETVSGPVTAFISGKPTKVAMDGTNYTASANGLVATGTTLETLQANSDLIGNSYIFYLDAYGNVVAKDLSEETFGNYALVLDSAGGTSVNGLANKGEVKLLLNDGTTAAYSVNMLASAGRFNIGGTNDVKEAAMAKRLEAGAMKNQLVTYAVDDNKSSVTIGDPNEVTGFGAVANTRSGSKVMRSTANYNFGANSVTVSDGTLFFVASSTTGDGKYDRFSVISGLSKMPASEMLGAYANGAVYRIRTVDNNTTNAAKAVLILDDQNNFKGTNNYVYISGGYTQTNDQVKNNIFEYPAIFEDTTTATSKILVKNNNQAYNEVTKLYVPISKGNMYEYVMHDGYAELFLTNNTVNNYVTTQVKGKSMDVRLGTDGTPTAFTLGTTVINAEDTDNIYVMGSEPSDAMSIAAAKNVEGYVSFIIVRDSDVHFRTVQNTTGHVLTINGRDIPNGGTISVANGFDITVTKIDGVAPANGGKQLVIYAKNDNASKSGYDTGDFANGKGAISMPANSTVILGSVNGNTSFDPDKIPDGGGTTPPPGGTTVGNLTFVTDANIKGVTGLVDSNDLKIQFTPDVGGFSGANYTFDYKVEKGGAVLTSGTMAAKAAVSNLYSNNIPGLYTATDKYTITLSNLKVTDFYSATVKSDVAGVTGTAGSDGANGKIAVSTETNGSALSLKLSGIATNKANVTFKIEGLDPKTTPTLDAGLKKNTDGTYTTKTATSVSAGELTLNVFTSSSAKAAGAVTITILSVTDESTSVPVTFVLAAGSEKYATLAGDANGAAYTGGSTVTVGGVTVTTGLPFLDLAGNLSDVSLKVTAGSKKPITVANYDGTADIPDVTVDKAVKGEPITVTIEVTPVEYTVKTAVVGVTNSITDLTFDKDGDVKTVDIVGSGLTNGDYYRLTSSALSDPFVLTIAGAKLTLAGGEFNLPEANLLDDTFKLTFDVKKVPALTVLEGTTGVSADGMTDGVLAVATGTEITLNVEQDTLYYIGTAPTAGITADKVQSSSSDGTITYTMGAANVVICKVVTLGHSYKNVAGATTGLTNYKVVLDGETTAITTGQYVPVGATLVVTTGEASTANQGIDFDTSTGTSTINNWTPSPEGAASTKGEYKFNITADTLVVFQAKTFT